MNNRSRGLLMLVIAAVSLLRAPCTSPRCRRTDRSGDRTVRPAVRDTIVQRQSRHGLLAVCQT